MSTNNKDMIAWYIGGSRGGVPGACPQGSRFFRFDIQIFWNVTASGVHAPLRGPRPPTGNPGSATVIAHTHKLGSSLVIQTSITQAVDGGQLPGHD